jgi:small GTP-binding protein
MIQKKICMLGASGVGKTSLIRQFVQSIFSEKYHTTIGVKIDKKQIIVDEQDVTLMLWDLQGEDAEFKIRPSFLRGASGYLLVVDLTRHETLVTAYSIQKMIENEVGEVPHLILFNKNDLTESFEITDDEIKTVAAENSGYIKTSAKTGERVEEAFSQLAVQMIGK